MDNCKTTGKNINARKKNYVFWSSAFPQYQQSSKPKTTMQYFLTLLPIMQFPSKDTTLPENHSRFTKSCFSQLFNWFRLDHLPPLRDAWASESTTAANYNNNEMSEQRTPYRLNERLIYLVEFTYSSECRRPRTLPLTIYSNSTIIYMAHDRMAWRKRSHLFIIITTSSAYCTL